MSRVRNRYRSLETILGLRRLVERQARSATLLAEQRVDSAKRQQDSEHSRLEETVSAWTALHQGGSFAPELVVSWSGAVNRQVERLDAASAALQGEQSELQHARTRQNVAGSERDCAEALWRRARFRYAAWREEQAMAEVGDAITRSHMTKLRS